MAKGYNGDLSHSTWTDGLWVAIKLLKSKWLAETVNDGYPRRMVSEILMYFVRIAEKTHMLPTLEDIVFRCRPQEFTVDDIRNVFVVCQESTYLNPSAAIQEVLDRICLTLGRY